MYEKKAGPQIEGRLLMKELYLNEYILADEQSGKHPHGDGDLLELSADGVADNVSDYAKENTVGDAVGKRHHDDGDECHKLFYVKKEVKYEEESD